jgi:hypothetical protein
MWHNRTTCRPIASTKNLQDDFAKFCNTIESGQPDARRSTRKWEKKLKFIVLISVSVFFVFSFVYGFFRF